MATELVQGQIGENTQQIGNALCLSCGFCCRGVIFSSLVLQPDELERVTQLQLPIYQHRDAHNVLKQPCPCHVDSKCSIYEHRFHACKSYKCELLKRLLEGRINLEEALGVVQMTRSIEEKIYDQLGGQDRSKTVWMLVKEFIESSGMGDSIAKRKDHAELLLGVRILSLMCHRHFEPRMHPELNTNDRPIIASQIPSAGKELSPLVA